MASLGDKALISARAKKFIASQLFATQSTQQFTGCFPNHDWLCHPLPPFVYRRSCKKDGQG